MNKGDGLLAVCVRLVRPYLLVAGLLLWLMLGLAFSQAESERYAISAGRAVAVDDDGNIYIGGSTEGELAGLRRQGESDAFLAKFDNDGNLQWLRQFGSLGRDTVADLVTHDDGSVFVVGSSRDFLIGEESGGQTGFLAKFDREGNELWRKELALLFANGVTMDAEGNLLVSGLVPAEASKDRQRHAALHKYDPTGNLLWRHIFSVAGDESMAGIARDNQDNLYVAGSTSSERLGGSPISGNAYLAKFDSAGQHLWTRQFGGVMNDFLYGVTADGEGNVFVTGTTSNPLGVKEYSEAEFRQDIAVDAFLASYDTHGRKRWIKQFGAGESYAGFDVTVDSTSHTIVVGKGNGNLGGEPQGRSDAFVVKYDRDGTMLWAHQFGTPEFDRAEGVAVDATGHIYVTGYLDEDWDHYNATSRGGRYVFLAKYHPDGQQLWFRTFESPVTNPEQRR